MRSQNAVFLVYTNISYRKSFYISSNITNNFVSLLPHIIVLEVIMATREKGRKKIKPEAPQEASRQFKVTDPISMTDLENIYTRRGKYPSQPPPFGPKTWEMA